MLPRCPPRGAAGPGRVQARQDDQRGAGTAGLSARPGGEGGMNCRDTKATSPGRISHVKGFELIPVRASTGKLCPNLWQALDTRADLAIFSKDQPPVTGGQSVFDVTIALRAKLHTRGWR